MRGSAGSVTRLAAVVTALVLSATSAAAQVTIPEDQELAVGRAVAARLMAQHGVVVDPDWLAFLSGLRDRVVPFSGRTQVPYRVTILDHREPNAVSTPGWIFVTTGLIRLNPDVEAWAFVVAHEVAHAARRHVAQHVARAQAGQIASILVAILTGSPTAGDVVQLLLRISTLGFSRELEVEADREALRMMVEAGFDPQAAVRTLSWFNEVTGGARRTPTGPARTRASRTGSAACSARTRSSRPATCPCGSGTSAPSSPRGRWCCGRSGFPSTKTAGCCRWRQRTAQTDPSAWG